MNPEDDMSWPECGAHTPAVRHWCDWTRAWILRGNDASDIQTGTRICVPIVPAYDFYAEVSIGAELIAGISAELALVFGSDPFSLSEDLIPLGLWTEGEGRLSIATAVDDWALRNPADKCTANSHSFKQEMELQKMEGEAEKKADRWCMAYHQMCYPCYTATLVTPLAPVSFDASSFGIDPKDFRGVTPQSSGGNLTNTSREQAAKDALRARFGNRSIVTDAQRSGAEAVPISDNTWHGPELFH